MASGLSSVYRLFWLEWSQILYRRLNFSISIFNSLLWDPYVIKGEKLSILATLGEEQ